MDTDLHPATHLGASKAVVPPRLRYCNKIGLSLSLWSDPGLDFMAKVSLSLAKVLNID